MFGKDKRLEQIAARLDQIESAIGTGPIPKSSHVRGTDMLERIAVERNPEFSVHKIENGYLAVTNNAQAMRVSMTYCADAKALADFIIASSARKKLNVPEQMDLFDNAKKAPEPMANNNPF
jgi:hypothetical protein